METGEEVVDPAAAGILLLPCDNGDPGGPVLQNFKSD
jgi:hypothetical protein